MTIIEFFDRTPIENMISCMTICPDKIIFIGDCKPMKKQGEVYQRFLEKRGLNVELSYRSINKNNLNSIVETLSEIVDEENECTFDLTGGEDLVLVAMGYVFGKYSDTKKVSMHRFNVRNGNVIDCDADGIVPYEGEPSITVEENIILHGGSIVFSEQSGYGTPAWNFSEDFVKDIDVMWNICKADPGLWNTQTNVLGEIEKYGACDDPLHIVTNIALATEHMQNHKTKFIYVKGLMKALERAGLIYGLRNDEEYLSFGYKNAQVKSCLVKAGTILELKVLLVAWGMRKPNGEPLFDDALNGVFIDWDGTLHNREDEAKDTGNEIDVILMRGLVPVFISCKNGAINDDELYKLNTVAERFGGKYAKKVLIASQLGKQSGAYEYFRQRTKDMKIDLIDDVHKMTDEQLAKRLRGINA